MRFDTNLYEARQRWIQLMEDGIPHPTNPNLTWQGGPTKGGWMTKTGTFVDYGGSAPQFTSQQLWDDAKIRDARIAARRVASKTVAPVVKKSLLSRAMGLISGGAKLASVIGVIDMFASKAGAEEIDWEKLYAEPEVTGGISDEDQAIQDAIEAGTLDSGGNLPMGPFQDPNMYAESYKNRNHNTCLREQFYGF